MQRLGGSPSPSPSPCCRARLILPCLRTNQLVCVRACVARLLHSAGLLRVCSLSDSIFFVPVSTEAGGGACPRTQRRRLFRPPSGSFPRHDAAAELGAGQGGGEQDENAAGGVEEIEGREAGTEAGAEPGVAQGLAGYRLAGYRRRWLRAAAAGGAAAGGVVDRGASLGLVPWWEVSCCEDR